ncbi:MAG: DUF2220 family protein [Erysipelotrichaceae bacterium]
MMKQSKYTNDIIEYILWKYEGSKASKGSLKDIKIRITPNKIFPKYNDSTNYKETELINDTIKSLTKYIDIIYDKDNDISHIELKQDKTILEETYKLINRTNPRTEEVNYITLLNNITTKSNTIINFKNFALNKLINYKPIASYVSISKHSDTYDIIKAIEYLESNTTDLSLRKFSIILFNNSKRFNDIIGKTLKIIREFSNDESLIDLDDDELLDNFNISKNPSFTYLKGNITIKVNNQLIDLKDLNGEFALSTSNLNNLSIINLNVERIVTVENLTSFYDIKADNTLFIYLGGFHSSLRRSLLLNLYEFNPNVSYYHFGDIDAGGFYILNHLINKTNIDFKPIYMDIDTLSKYQLSSIQLTKNDIIRLNKLKSLNLYNDVIDYMLSNNIKLEQEIVEFE